MNIPEVMQGLNSEHHLCQIKARHLLREHVVVLRQEGIEIASGVILHDQIQMMRVLECMVKF